MSDGKRWGDASGTSWKLRGEAVAVDLPGGRTLFALLRGSGADPAMYQAGLIWRGVRDGGTASAALPDVGTPGTSLMTVREIIKRERVKVELPVVDYPMLVTFADVADPRSVAAVDSGNLAASFGSGVQLKRIVVEVTDEPVTMGIEKRLKWLVTSVTGYLDGRTTGGGPSCRIFLIQQRFGGNSNEPGPVYGQSCYGLVQSRL